MFTKSSRYSKLPDVVAVDAKGRRLASKSLRLLPEVSGTFRHIVNQGDRLDHLAHKYYKDSKKWWRIVDANPEIADPAALLGAHVLVAVHISINPIQNPPRWDRLVSTLAATPGVAKVTLEKEIRMETKRIILTRDGADHEVRVEGEVIQTVLALTLNHAVIEIPTLGSSIEAMGFRTGLILTEERTGKRIVIPPNVI